MKGRIWHPSSSLAPSARAGALAVSVLALVCAGAPPAQGTGADRGRSATTVVVGTENPLVDVPAVQAAVDQGGTVVLRGTFDFGTDAGNHIIVPGRPAPAQDAKGTSTVFIYRRDVTIVGERGAAGELLTVIKNGMPTFWIGWDGEVLREPPAGTYNVDYGTEILPVDALGRVRYRDGTQDAGYAGPQTRYARAYQNVSARIESIVFDSPKHYGVKATAGRDVYVVDNTFRDVEFGGLVHGNTQFDAKYIAAAFIGIGLFYAPFTYPAISGDLVATGNTVDGVGTEPIYTYVGEAFGLGAMITNAAVTIDRNEVRNVARGEDGVGSDATGGGIILVDTYTTGARLSHNTVYNAATYGIWGITVAAPCPGPTIDHNTVADSGIGVLLHSIPAPQSGATIHQNVFLQDGVVGGGSSCIIASRMTEAEITENRLEGDYTAPLVVLAGSSSCRVLENRDARSPAPPWPPTYFLDADSADNLIRAASGSVFDLGTGNTASFPGSGH